jgi:hypothetical protein
MLDPARAGLERTTESSEGFQQEDPEATAETTKDQSKLMNAM